MIKQIDEAILSSVRKGLSELLPADSIVLGEPVPGKKSMVFVNSSDFIIEDVCLGTLRQDMKEEAEETFDGDGKTTVFKLSRAPVNHLLMVEYPKGTARHEPDDFSADLEKGVIEFRDPPPKGKAVIRIRYDLPRPVGEKSFLKFLLTYNIFIIANTNEDRDKLTLASLEALYRDMPMLVKYGVEDMKLVRGYTAPADGDKTLRQSILVYNVQTTLEVETRMPPMEKIEIKKL